LALTLSIITNVIVLRESWICSFRKRNLSFFLTFLIFMKL